MEHIFRTGCRLQLQNLHSFVQQLLLRVYETNTLKVEISYDWMHSFLWWSLFVISFIRTWSTFSARRSYEVVGALAMKWGKEEGKSRWGWWVSLGELLPARALSHAVLRARVYPSSMPTKLRRFNFFLSPIAYLISQVREVSGSCARMSGGWTCIRSGAMKEMILWDLGLQFSLALSFTVI